MDERSTVPDPSPASDDLVFQVTMMIRAFWASPLRGVLLALGGCLVFVIGANAYVQTLLNDWNQPFYDALARRDIDGFVSQLLAFFAIAGTLLVLNVAQAWLNQMTKLKLRAGLVRDLVGLWMQPMRGFRLASSGALGVNPDQRMHEDAKRLTELSTDLGIGLLQSTILLMVFVSVLWSLSGPLTLHLSGYDLTIPGYMVFAAFLYVGIASLASWLVGKPLIALNAERYAREAELRFSLVRVNEHIDAIALAEGEADEESRLKVDIDTVLLAMRRLVTTVTRLTWVTSGYGWISMIAPIIIAAPVYFSGQQSFGAMMVAVGAFNQVQASLRWFIDNFSIIADWRAMLLRVASFRQALIEAEELVGDGPRITRDEGLKDRMYLQNLAIASPSGSTRLREPQVEIFTGDRVLIIGDPGTGKTLLFRALAGLWPFGSGHVELPGGAAMMFMPRTPYVPPGLLKAALTYPRKPDGFSDADCHAALARLGLERLADRLGVTARWDRDLSEDDRQALVFARMLLQRPDWIVIDEALDTLDEVQRARVTEIFAGELATSTVIHIGRSVGGDALFQRVLHLEKIAEGALEPRPRRISRRRDRPGGRTA